MATKSVIQNFTFKELEGALVEKGLARFRAGQIFGWIYGSFVESFEKMRNISKTDISKLSENFRFGKFKAEEFLSKDGTVKFLFTLEDGLAIESVLMPMRDSYTMCLSSQVGCPLDCKFCMTGRYGFRRNLEPWEMVEQALHIRRKYGQEKNIGNIVFMGMGEPLLNLDNLVKALAILQSEHGLNMSKRSITVSSVGITPAIEKLGKKCNVRLAISLNAPDKKTRDAIMPVNKKYPLEELFGVLRKYPLKGKDYITFEYVLIEGINDSLTHVKGLTQILHGLKCKVNVIPFNEDESLKFKKPSEKSTEDFVQALIQKGITATLRKSKGLDVKGACGQLVGRR